MTRKQSVYRRGIGKNAFRLTGKSLQAVRQYNYPSRFRTANKKWISGYNLTHLWWNEGFDVEEQVYAELKGWND